MRPVFKKILFGLSLTIAITSCNTTKLAVPSVGYQSVRTNFAQPKEIPSTAKIAVQYFINASGEVLAVIYNLTDEIITVDQTKSFLVNTDGLSLSYYDPNVYTTSKGEFNSSTGSASFNLGAIANAFGVGGPLGSLLNGTTIGSSSTMGTTTQNSVSVFDQPQVKIGPHGRIALSKQYASGIGIPSISSVSQTFLRQNYNSSPLKFSICVSYTIGENGTPQKLITKFYVNDNIIEPVQKGKVNGAFQSIYEQKTDALAENFFIMNINNNIPLEGYDMWGGANNEGKVISSYSKGSLIDFQ